MTMNYKQWEEILGAVDKKKYLSKDNVIDEIKKKLKVKSKDEHKKWEGAGFDVNHLFEFIPSSKSIQYTLLHFAVKANCLKTVGALLEIEANPLSKASNGKTPRDLAKDDSMKQLLKEAEEKNNLTQDKDDNKDTTSLLEETEKKQPTSAITKGLAAGGSTAALGTAAAVALFATGTVAVELIPIVIAVVAVTVAALAVGGVTYMMSKPSTKVDEVEEEQGIDGRRKV